MGKTNKPKIEFRLNVPVVLTINKMFKSGESEYGPWYAYDVLDDKTESTMFADGPLHEMLSKTTPGAIVTILKEQIGITKAYTWKVNGAIFDKAGSVAPPPPASPVEGNTTTGNFRAHRKALMLEALEDASQVCELFNETLQTPSPFTLNREDVRTIAISFMIELSRKTR